MYDLQNNTKNPVGCPTYKRLEDRDIVISHCTGIFCDNLFVFNILPEPPSAILAQAIENK